MENKSVFIIILNWNNYKDTIECVNSCLKINYGSFKIIIVDNGSTNESLSELRKAFPSLEIIETGSNLGFAEGNNIGIRSAIKQNADHVLLLNNDTVVDPEILNAFLAQASNLPLAGIFAAKIYYFLNPSKIWFAGGKWDTSTPGFKHIGMGAEDSEEFSKVMETDYACGCALFASIPMLKDIGLLDPEYFLNFEETDLCYRAKAKGFKIYFVPKAKVWHKVSATIGNKSALQRYFLTRNLLLWSNKHLSTFEFLAVLSKTILFLHRGVVQYPPNPNIFTRLYYILKLIIELIRGKSANKTATAKYYGIRDYFLGQFGDCPVKARKQLL
jgi:hypothetical protein